MDEDNVIQLDDARLKKLKNLKPYRNKTDEEIRAIFAARVQVTPPVKSASTGRKEPSSTEEYDKKFNKKLLQIQNEYTLDMNDSNDTENLRNLVRQQIQLENVVRDIEAIQKKEVLATDDYLKLEKLGKFQSGILSSISTLEDKLGISRKFRKEKKADDMPVFMNDLLARAKEFFEKQTIEIRCPTCKIELSRLWLNFPNLKNEVEMSLECFKCGEMIIWSH